MHRLSSPVQHYPWGSTTQLPELLGVEPDGRPVAELWMGAHPSAPSTTRDGRPLPQVIAAEGERLLGPAVHQEFGSVLPYLFKVLAVARPLSLQVHPDPRQAREGFLREERAGVPLGSPERSFKDAHHKPEMVIALTRFDALSGFRRPGRVRELLTGLDVPLAVRLRELLSGPDEATALRHAFEHLLTPAEGLAEQVAAVVDACARRLADGSSSPRADATVVDLGDWYPGDPGAVASLFLNRVTLAPGEAMYVPAGSVHAYLHGCALEIMACSDNVLRAGLTSKHIDAVTLLACTDYHGGPPSRPRPVEVSAGTSVYRAVAPEFGVVLTTLDALAGSTAPGASVIPVGGPRIVLCLDGEVELRTSRERLRTARGDVVLVGDDEGELQACGTGTVATAFVPVAASTPASGSELVSVGATPVNTSVR
ncbi:mannose-6-phosphate isomerase, class I [Cellulomonas bogoriensis]|uniref:mannose-6-phosphate isomerase n=1 Tax=Cellulomonas bogoriensis 69B4 = DSM 16987 TaxID=1386082 RepID=A0A0A0BZC4_9CELL|nr:mannose-6-phosphate isomerase [Cellulomonas bogoriensis 69B4 = DSM 16987]